MAQDGFGTSPFILPNMFSSPGAALENTIDRQERERQRKYEFHYREQQRQNQYRLFNIREIDQDTDPKRFKTGRERFDRFSQNELLGIKNKALSQYVNLPPEEAKYLLGKDMEGLVQWHTAVSGKIDEIEEGLKSFNKTFSNVNPIEAHEMAFLNLGNDYLKRDETGKLERVNPSIIQPKNYVEDLLKPENISQLSIDTTPFQKAIESIPKTSVGDKEYISKKGFAHKFNWSGLKTDYSDIVEDEKGRPVKFELKSDRKVGDMKLIPEDLKEYLMSQPHVKLAADRLWENEKRKIVQTTQTEIDPRTEGELKDAFLYNQADKYLPHDIKKETSDVVPKPSVSISNYFGQSGVNDVYKRIDEGINAEFEKGFKAKRFNSLKDDEQAAVKVAVQNAGYEVDPGGRNIFLTKTDDGFIKVYKTSNGKIVTDPKMELATLSYQGTNLPKQADVGGKRSVIQESKTDQTTPPPKPSSKKKEYKGLDSKGNPIFE